MLSTWLKRLLLHPRRKLSAADVLDERIRHESISTAIGASGVMLIALFVSLIFPKDAPQAHYISAWLLLQLVVGVFWLGFIAQHAKHRTPRTRRWWPYLSTIVCSFYGFMWGAGWVLFVGNTDSTHVQLAVMFSIILCGVFTGGVFATIFHLPSLLSFTLCSFMPPLISSFINSGIFYFWFGASSVIYMIATTAFALNLHTFLMDTLEQREEKALLAQQLAEEKQRVEQVSYDKTRFLAAASHDLRQPLQALHFFQQSLEVLIKQGNVTEQQRILGNMEASITALNGLLNAMLDISRLDAGTLPIQRQIFPLNALFRRLYQQYEPIAAEAGLTLRYVDTSLHIESDPTQLERILRNLVENAIKHMGKPGCILLGGRRCEQHLRIEVWDNGVGIPLQEQESIFREFYQLHNPERKRSRGVGLGLAIIKRIAAALEHDIGLQSRPGKGCVFSVTVPIAVQQTSSIIMPSQNKSTSPPRGKVLVIEDDRDVLESLHTLLHLWGYTVVTTFEPDPAAIIAVHPDIAFIISDYQLGAGVNGVKVIHQLRQAAKKTIPALLITGNTSSLLIELLEKSSIPVSYKPISPKELKKFIGSHN
ncbi:MAG: hypothetical protein BWK73_41655 [Thiothrix lacustris]|uniref:histidine kinase n=1 Tax=Thiothrix lacustris TaxID=525917 RepID=A0A1Y1QCR9_9GAMM|nr:MAG: hypothetical protein BWK73_41655 [Thiothrix lacustris]